MQRNDSMILIILSSIILTVKAQIPIDTASTPLPSYVDNSTTQYFPGIFNQEGESCGSANGIGYVFTYEINAARDADAADSVNRYPFFGTFNYLNNGSSSNGTHMMFLDAWDFAKSNGIFNAVDFGSIEPKSTKWVDGYQNYFNAMHNRVAKVDSLSFLEAGTFTKLKQWLYDHGNGAPNGGVFTVTVAAYNIQSARITTNPDSGKSIVRTFGPEPNVGAHALAVVGYNDSIAYDYNRDNRITTDVDINDDGKIDIGDSELGAFILANSWGESSFNRGFLIAPYRLFVTPIEKGGSLSNMAYFITVHEEYNPKRTFRVALTHNNRNTIALSVGIAKDTNATEPTHLRSIKQFTYAGGNLPMGGYRASSTLEIGLDISDLIDSIPGATSAAYFLVIDEDGSQGQCDSLSLIDYSSDIPEEVFSPDAPEDISEGKNIFKIIAPIIDVPLRTSRYNPLKKCMIRQVANRIQAFITSDIRMISVFSCNGSLLKSNMVPSIEGWYSLPIDLYSGTYIIRIVNRRKILDAHKIVVIR